MRALATALALALAAGACVAPAGPRGRPLAPEGIAFVFASPGGLVALDGRGQVLGPLLALPAESEPSSPSLAPDSQAVVFALTRISKTAGFGSDVWMVGLDGAGARVLLEHERDSVFYSSPLLDPSGQFLYVQRRAAVIQSGQYIGNEDSIERIDLRTKERRRVVAHAADHALSPDGKTLAYVRVTDGQPQGLWRVSVDGTGNVPFFSIHDTWWYLQSPRFSPDGSVLVFSGAGHNPRSEALRPKLAHLGIPSDLFLAPTDGTSVLGFHETVDDVIPAWSPDGSEIAYVQGGALHVVNVSERRARQLARHDRFFFGDLVWLKR